jgi:hypothetical protein
VPDLHGCRGDVLGALFDVAEVPRRRHTGAFRFPWESPAIPKRKPPSQRPERKLDETALAIARELEATRVAKPSESGRPASQKSRPEVGPVGKITARRKSVGPAVTPSTKRKTGGGG